MASAENETGGAPMAPYDTGGAPLSGKEPEGYDSVTDAPLDETNYGPGEDWERAR